MGRGCRGGGDVHPAGSGYGALPCGPASAPTERGDGADPVCRGADSGQQAAAGGAAAIAGGTNAPYHGGAGHFVLRGAGAYGDGTGACLAAIVARVAGGGSAAGLDLRAAFTHVAGGPGDAPVLLPFPLDLV